MSVAATLGSLDSREGLRSVSRSTSSSRAARRSALAGYEDELEKSWVVVCSIECTYTGLELRQQVLANTVIVALLAERVREVVDGRPLCLGKRQLGRSQLLARCDGAVAVQRAFAADFCHSEWQVRREPGCVDQCMLVLEMAAERWVGCKNGGRSCASDWMGSHGWSSESDPKSSFWGVNANVGPEQPCRCSLAREVLLSLGAWMGALRRTPARATATSQQRRHTPNPCNCSLPTRLAHVHGLAQPQWFTRSCSGAASVGIRPPPSAVRSAC